MLGLAVTFKPFYDFPCFRVFLDLKQFNRHKLWCPSKCVPFALFSYFSLFYIVLALSSAATSLSNKILIFHDSQGPTIKSHDFPGLENEMLKFHDFPGFPWPVRNPVNLLFYLPFPSPSPWPSTLLKLPTKNARCNNWGRSIQLGH